MPIDIAKKEKCCGCRSCEQICPQGCIKMDFDNEGFLYPILSNEDCTDCDLCIRVCPILKPLSVTKFVQRVYAAWINDHSIRINSSSGGLFSVLASHVLALGGFVIGASFNDDNIVQHIMIDDINQLYTLRGSKYVQSDTGITFKKTREALNKDQWVLYSGTPCQIAGLKSYLQKDYEKLITIDLVCHGVPSPELFRLYIKNLEVKYNGAITEIKFRDKIKYGWQHMGSFKVNGKNQRSIKLCALSSPYYYGFLKGITSRPICYECPYTNLNREGDITLGDFWGVQKLHPEINAEKGVSLIIINSHKGKLLFNQTRTSFEYLESSIDNAILYNLNLQKPSTKNPKRDLIYDYLNESNFKLTAKKYLRPNNYRMKRFSLMIPIQLKSFIKSNVLQLKKRFLQ